MERSQGVRSKAGTILIVEKPIKPIPYIITLRRALGMDEIVSEETSEKDVLKVQLKEKMKSADRQTLEDVLKILNKDTEE